MSSENSKPAAYTDNNSGSASAKIFDELLQREMKQAATTNYGKKLPLELWLRIFGNLDRNDLEACEHVCLTWNALIRTNTNRLAVRDIDYVIISSKHVFSLIISSGQLIKVYKMDKFYQSDTIPDAQQMRVQTFRRPQQNEEWPLAKTQPNLVKPDPAKGPPIFFRQFQNELIVFHKPRCVYDAQGQPHDYDYDVIGLPCPDIVCPGHMPIPPTVFFNKLDTLLRDHRSIRFFAFQSFLLTDEFIAKFAHIVRPMVSIEKVVLLNFGSEALPSRRDFFFEGLLAEKKSEEEEG